MKYRSLKLYYLHHLTWKVNPTEHVLGCGQGNQSLSPIPRRIHTREKQSSVVEASDVASLTRAGTTHYWVLLFSLRAASTGPWRSSQSPPTDTIIQIITEYQTHRCRSNEPTSTLPALAIIIHATLWAYPRHLIHW